MKNKILVLGAFDRFNYGDILFPHIINYKFNKVENTSIEYYGMIKSDLSEIGGIPTFDINKFYQECNLPNNKVSVIIAGGEAINASWTSLYSSLNNIFYILSRTFERAKISPNIIDFNKIAKFFLNGQTELPYIFKKSDFTNVSHIILNSLGGSSIDSKVFSRYPSLLTSLPNVDYFSVRDNETYQIMEKNNLQVKLFPDSAIIMSEIFPINKLQKLVSDETLEFVNKNKGNYLFFQTNESNGVKNHSQIVEELTKIQTLYDTTICLCPIGKASGHSDQIPLKKISHALKSPAILFDNVTIWDIMYLIASSKCYSGTSLHGAITAMSFNVPYIGLKVRKLNNYLKTWGADGINKAIDFPDLSSQYLKAISTDRQLLSESRNKQINEINISFENIQSTLLSS